MGFGDSSAGSSWTICKQSAPHFRQITTPVPYHSIFTGLAPNQQCQSTELDWNEMNCKSPDPRSVYYCYVCFTLKMENEKRTLSVELCQFVSWLVALYNCPILLKVAHTRLPIVGFRSWSRFLAVSLQVTWVINPAVGCNYFPPGLQLSLQPLRGLLPVLLLGEQRHNGCEQFA